MMAGRKNIAGELIKESEAQLKRTQVATF